MAISCVIPRRITGVILRWRAPVSKFLEAPEWPAFLGLKTAELSDKTASTTAIPLRLWLGRRPDIAATMSVFKPRSRMISIRLSDEEYVGLKHLCTVSGARSVSDLAREAMRVLLNGTSRDDLLSARMEEFRVQMRSIDRKIDQLSDRIASVGNGTKG